MANATTQIIIQGRDQLSSVISSAAQRFGTEMRHMQGSALDLRDALAGVAGAMALNQVKNEFTGYDTAVRDMAKVTDESAQIIAAKISVLPAELGNMTELTQGYYQVLSAGVSGPAEAMDILTASAQAAKSAHLEQADVVRGVTKLMAGYAGEIGSASTAADLLFAIEKQGQTEFAELIPVIGDVAAVSHEMGVSQNEMGAAMAVISNTAGSTSEAATQYRAVLVNLMKPTETMQKALDGLGVSSGKAAVEQFGLAGTVDRLTQYAAKAGVPLGKLFESSEALLASAAMSRNGFEGYNTALDAMTTKAGGAERAFANWREGAQATDDLLRNALSNTLVIIGKELMPSVNGEIERFATYLDNNKNEVAAWGKALRYEFLDVMQSVQAMGIVLHGMGAGADIVGMGLYGVGAALGIENSQRGFESFAKAYEDNKTAMAAGEARLNELISQQDKVYAPPVANNQRPAAQDAPNPKTVRPTPTVVSGGSGKATAGKAASGKTLDMDGYGKSALAAMQAESQRAMDVLRAQLDAESSMAKRGYESQTLSLTAYYAERRRIIEAESQAEIQQQEQIVSRAQAEKERLATLNPGGTRGTEQISDQTRALDEKIKDAQSKIEVLKTQTSTSLADLSSEQAKAARERITQAMSDAQAVISATEQSLESRVVTGLETESTARAKLKDTIREQGEALDQDLVPQIERMMLVASNPKARAELQAMLDKIREMATEAKTQTWADGLSQGVKDYATEASDSFQTARDAATSAFSSMEDALIEFTTTGKLSVSDMVQSMLADIARLAIRQSITQPLASGLTSVIGSLLGGGSSWSGVNTSWSGAATTDASILGNSGFGLATGGIVSGPGTGTSDSIPTMLSNGEYVIREAAARKIGYNRLDALNNTGELPESARRGDRRSPVGLMGGDTVERTMQLDRTVDRSTLERIMGGNTVERTMQSARTVDRSTLERIMPSIHAHTNTIRETPTPFSFSGLQPFARGGVFGEAGTEAVMPLTRTSDGRLGVAASGGATQAKVNVTVHNTAGAQVRIEEGQTSNGEPDIKVMVENIAAGAVGRHGSAMNQALRQGGFRQPLVRRGF